jgi:hypothetical protein
MVAFAGGVGYAVAQVLQLVGILKAPWMES